MHDWLVLTATLPTSPSGLRVKVWRALKSTGAAMLREGVYLLPSAATTAPELWNIERAITEAGALAHMLVLSARDEAQEAAFRALFDRADLYREFLLAVKAARATLANAAESVVQKSLRGLAQQLASIQAGDFFPDKANDTAANALAALRREVQLRFSPDEPSPAPLAVGHRAIVDFQKKTWATRRRPWVDRLATAWLVRRFIDQSPTFLWLADARQCPPTAVGYDFDGATFSHVGDKVTFEVVAASFGLDDDPALKRVGELVHAIDVGGIVDDEAAGVEMLVRGLQAQHADDDALLVAALVLLDTLHAAAKAQP